MGWPEAISMVVSIAACVAVLWIYSRALKERNGG